ncbi:hypothetical protein JXL19_01760 [bacterium]|nr:hypothetical protein [bacterium]
MKRYILALTVIVMIVCLGASARAQFPIFFGMPNPFLPLLIPNVWPVAPAFAMFPSLPIAGPLLASSLSARSSLSLMSPIRMPQPLLRKAAATVTIYFNPAVSVIQITVLPITPLSPPVTVAAPTVTAPAIGPTALLLLPLLTGLTGPTQTKTLTRLSTTAPALPPLTGLSALLPLI